MYPINIQTQRFFAYSINPVLIVLCFGVEMQYCMCVIDALYRKGRIT